MSLPRAGLHPVPVETARVVAHAAFPEGNMYLRLRDEVGTLFDDEQFAAVYAAVYAREGQPALHPWQLALGSVMPFAEHLSARQAADAVRARIDWKYALGLDLRDEGSHYSVLSAFRTRLVAGRLEHTLLDQLLERCGERGWLKTRGRQRTDSHRFAPIRPDSPRFAPIRPDSPRFAPIRPDSPHVLGAVRALNQLDLVGETLRATLKVLAPVAPEWLQEQVTPEGYVRYGDRIEDTPRACPKRRRNARR